MSASNVSCALNRTYEVLKVSQRLAVTVAGGPLNRTYEVLKVEISLQLDLIRKPSESHLRGIESRTYAILARPLAALNRTYEVLKGTVSQWVHPTTGTLNRTYEVLKDEYTERIAPTGRLL